MVLEICLVYTEALADKYFWLIDVMMLYWKRGKGKCARTPKAIRVLDKGSSLKHEIGFTHINKCQSYAHTQSHSHTTHTSSHMC